VEGNVRNTSFVFDLVACTEKTDRQTGRRARPIMWPVGTATYVYTTLRNWKVATFAEDISAN